MSLTLPGLARWSDATLLALRVVTGGYLVHTTWGQMPGSARIAGIATGLAELDLPSTAVLPPFLATLQFTAGMLLVAGLLTRWAGLLLAAIVAVALIRSGFAAPFGSGWPQLMLLVLGLHFAASGAGRYGLDSLFGRRGSAAAIGARRR